MTRRRRGARDDAHLAIDARMIRHSGIGTYLRNLIPRIAAGRPSWRLTLLGSTEVITSAIGPLPPNVSTRACRSAIYTIREQLEIPAAIPRDADVFWAPHYNAPLLSRLPLVVTIHDVAHLQKTFVPGALKHAYAKTMLTRVTGRAEQIICDSEFTRSEIARLLPPTRATPRVIHIGVGEEWSMSPPPERVHDRPYLLFVGNVKPNKNLAALLRAFAIVSGSIPHDLVVVGKHDGLIGADAEAPELARAAGLRVQFKGEVSDRELRGYVAHAEALVFPSLYEGFGLPPLEAMAAGCPCIASTAASIPEVCGDGALYFDPRDANQIADRIRAVCDDAALRADLIARGRARAAQFTWERTTAATLDVLGAALDGSRPEV
jgi:glycosyltransferase involved in cell wall biosynthesis